jgi:hypothetical protein
MSHASEATPEIARLSTPCHAGCDRNLDRNPEDRRGQSADLLRTDSTRIATFMYLNEGSNRSYPEIGVRAGHHELSHHGRDPEKQVQISKINRYHLGLLAEFLQKLNAAKEGDGTLLQSAMILYGSGLSDGDRHNHDDLPILLAGRGGGTIPAGRHLRYPKETPLTNLYLAMLDRMGVAMPKFSDSTGKREL